MTLVGGGGWRGVCLQEQRAQLLGRLWWAGPTAADAEVPCSAAAAVHGGSTFHAEKAGGVVGEDIAA